MGRIFEVRAQGRERVQAFGARRTWEEAAELLEAAQARVASAGDSDQRYWIEQIDTTGLFQIPARPTPRERFTTRVATTSSEGSWRSVRVEILDAGRVVASYDRNYAMHQTFEPFRQGDRNLALIAPDYTATWVIDLETGWVIAAEAPSPDGFCPVGFYVPDWWDVHDGRKLPGELTWTVDDEWPASSGFGFVWGCRWGDDSSWKVQYLDLSDVQRGQLRRDERFGYLKLASRADAPSRDFIRCRSYAGRPEVEFLINQSYDLDTGGRTDLAPWA